MAQYSDITQIVPHEYRCKHVEQEYPHAYLRPERCEHCTVEDSIRAYQAVRADYYAGKGQMDDLAFDRWEKRLRDRWPNESAFWSVGVSKG